MRMAQTLRLVWIHAAVWVVAVGANSEKLRQAAQKGHRLQTVKRKILFSPCQCTGVSNWTQDDTVADANAPCLHLVFVLLAMRALLYIAFFTFMSFWRLFAHPVQTMLQCQMHSKENSALFWIMRAIPDISKLAPFMQLMITY